MPLNNPLPSEAPQLYCVSFVQNYLPANREVLRAFSDPYPQTQYALLEQIGLDQLPPPDFAKEREDHNRLYFLFLPGGSTTAFDEQKRGEQWMAKPDDPNAEPTVEILMRSDRVLWRPGRAMMQGAADRLHETLLALADFSYYESELRKLEHELHADGEILSRDVPLTTAAVNKHSLHAVRHVHERTCTMTERRIRYSRLERPLEKPSITLPGAGRRLVSELLVQCEVQERLKAVDERLEVYEDTYELANDRLMEYGNFRAEAKLEIWIIVILLAELLLMVAEIGFYFWSEHK
jgi:hypothetical protein